MLDRPQTLRRRTSDARRRMTRCRARSAARAAIDCFSSRPLTTILRSHWLVRGRSATCRLNGVASSSDGVLGQPDAITSGVSSSVSSIDFLRLRVSRLAGQVICPPASCMRDRLGDGKARQSRLKLALEFLITQQRQLAHRFVERVERLLAGVVDQAFAVVSSSRALRRSPACFERRRALGSTCCAASAILAGLAWATVPWAGN